VVWSGGDDSTRKHGEVDVPATRARWCRKGGGQPHRRWLGPALGARPGVFAVVRRRPEKTAREAVCVGVHPGSGDSSSGPRLPATDEVTRTARSLGTMATSAAATELRGTAMVEGGDGGLGFAERRRRRGRREGEAAGRRPERLYARTRAQDDARCCPTRPMGGGRPALQLTGGPMRKDIFNFK
jgi:hypothetical protein